ncbi:MAG: iron-sulfur cluster assembly scaffold protein [Methanomassiliicoccales archaeon]|jgi:nitrogen fixation NifU-like protein
MRYTQKVMDHFMNPRNVGEIPDADGLGIVGNPADGDVVHIYIKVKDDVLSEVTFKTMGCAAAIATSSKVTELAKGMTLKQALELSRQNVADALDGLPPGKMECSNLGADALHQAIREYLIKSGRESEAPPALKDHGKDDS